MSQEDDVAYRRSVKNTAALLAVVAVVVVAGLVLPTFFVSPPLLATSVSVYDPNGLTLSVSINTTRAFSPSSVGIRVWMNGSSQIENITAQNAWPGGAEWPKGPAQLWKNPCLPGWPFGVGVMKGRYDLYNYTSGTLLALSLAPHYCPTLHGAPRSFLVEPRGSQAVVSMNGSIAEWNLVTTVTLQKTSLAQEQITSGTYTVVASDEWGDVGFLYFTVPVGAS